jgi:hypothetical protein
MMENKFDVTFDSGPMAIVFRSSADVKGTFISRFTTCFNGDPGPASGKGILEAGDVLLAINGRDLDGKDLKREITPLLRAPGPKVLSFMHPTGDIREQVMKKVAKAKRANDIAMGTTIEVTFLLCKFVCDSPKGRAF